MRESFRGFGNNRIGVVGQMSGFDKPIRTEINAQSPHPKLHHNSSEGSASADLAGIGSTTYRLSTGATSYLNSDILDGVQTIGASTRLYVDRMICGVRDHHPFAFGHVR